MDIEGKGSLLLLLVSSLVLCWNVASHPTCLEGSKCHTILQDLHYKAIFSTMRMHYNSLELFVHFVRQYARDPFFFMPAVRVCHTADIPAPARQEEARKLQHKDIIHAVLRYLHSWNEPLTHLALEAHRLPKLHDLFILRGGNISEIHQELKELTREIASQLDPEITDTVDSASWPALQSLQSSDEKTLQFTVYNTLRCLLTDLRKTESLLELLKCRVTPDDNCSYLSIPAVSEIISKDSPSEKSI